jgi:outer membrane protein OmpA-like peptidoglycan-associated protein
MPQPASAASVSVGFAPGSATLPSEAVPTIKQFATTHGQGTIMVTGHGETDSPDPKAQSEAVILGLKRAQAVADVLTASGVPSASVMMNAEASGRGAVLHLLQ